MNKKNKILTTALLSVLTLSACGSIAYVSTTNKNNEFISNQLNSNIVENGISVKYSIVEDSTAKYGAQIFNYSVNTESQLNNVLYNLKYIDGSNVDLKIFTISHNKENKTYQVDCNEVFTKQVILTLYLEHNEDIKAEILIDFVEILTIDSDIIYSEDEPIITSDKVNSTGGSILVDKTIKNSTYKWNENFKNNLKEKFLHEVLESDYDLLTYAWITLPDITPYFREDNRKSFNTYEFLSNISVDIELDNDYSESMNLFDIDEVDYEAIVSDSSIWNYAIDHSFVVNNKTYNYIFEIELELSSVLASSLLSEVSQLKFGGEISSSDKESSSTNLIQVFESIDLNGDISKYSQFNMTRGSYMYQNGTYFENSTIKKIGVPIKTINDYTKDNVLSVFVVNFNDVNAKGTEYISKHELVLKANTYTSNTINEWVYFDCNINVGSGETLAFITDTDTIFAGYPSTSLTDYKFKFDVLDGSSLIESPGNILFDVYKSN